MEKIVFKNTDGSCGIITPTAESLELLTIAEIAEKDVPTGLEYRITDESNIPTDRTFRNAWTDDNVDETVDVDMTKAVPIHMDNLRVIRDTALLALDLPYIQALETGSDTVSIIALKVALRDMPTNNQAALDAATTPEELKAIMPAELL